MVPRGSSGESDLRGSWHVCGAWKLLSHQEFLRLRPHLGPGPHRLTRAPQSWRLDASPPPAPSWPGPAPPGTGLSSVATCLFCWKNLYCGGVSSGRTQPPGRGHQENLVFMGLAGPTSAALRGQVRLLGGRPRSGLCSGYVAHMGYIKGSGLPAFPFSQEGPLFVAPI